MKTLQCKKPKKSIKFGDIFSLGNHLLVCGSSTNPQIIKNLIDKLREVIDENEKKKEKVKLILADPPYAVGYVESKQNLKEFSKEHKKIANDHIQTEEEYKNFTKSWMELIRPYLEEKNAFYIFNSDKMLFSLKEGLNEAKYRFTQLLIWIKNQAVVGRLDYMPQHELIAYGWYGKHEFLKSKDKTIITYPKPQKSKLHPTMKPIGLLRRLILNSTKINDIVFDPFGGSGSSLIACEHTKRRCLMVELDMDYCQVIIDRFEKLTGIKAKLIN